MNKRYKLPQAPRGHRTLDFDGFVPKGTPYYSRSINDSKWRPRHPGHPYGFHSAGFFVAIPK